jgi:hypothetical protein
MVVLCSNPKCGAVLRIGSRPSLLDVVLAADKQGPYFTCPRCQMRNPVAERRRMPRPSEPSHTQSGGSPAA